MPRYQRISRIRPLLPMLRRLPRLTFYDTDCGIHGVLDERYDHCVRQGSARRSENLPGFVDFRWSEVVALLHWTIKCDVQGP